METITYAEAKKKLDEYYEQKFEKIKNLYEPNTKLFTGAFESLNHEMTIRENTINLIFRFAEDDPYFVKRPQRMD
jgi:hypothetical protein